MQAQFDGKKGRWSRLTAGRLADNLDADYAAAGFGGRLGFGRKPALIIVDFCMAYLVPESPLFAEVEEELAVNEKLLTACRDAGIPVIFTGGSTSRTCSTWQPNTRKW